MLVQNKAFCHLATKYVIERRKLMAVYIVFILIGVLFAVFFGAIGYFISYLHEEKKREEKSKKKSEKYNPMSSAGWFSW